MKEGPGALYRKHLNPVYKKSIFERRGKNPEGRRGKNGSLEKGNAFGFVHQRESYKKERKIAGH